MGRKTGKDPLAHFAPGMGGTLLTQEQCERLLANSRPARNLLELSEELQDQPTQEEWDAYHRLCDAAPDLLEACKVAFGDLLAHGMPEGSTTYRLLESAIAKATGEPHA